MSVLGNPLTSLQRVAGYPRFRDAGETTLEDKYYCLWSSWVSLTPAKGTESAEISGMYLFERGAEKDGDAAIVTLIYRYPGSKEPVVDGADTYESRAAVTVSDTGDRLPTVEWIRRKRVKTFTKSAANVTLNVGVRVSPPGMSSPTSNEWLKTGRGFVDGQGYTEIVDVYEWKDGGWPSSYGNSAET